MEQVLTNSAKSLRSLYYFRFAVQVLWAVTVILISKTIPTAAGFLLIIYPLWDVACTIYEIRKSSYSHATQTINAVLGIAVAAGIAFTVFDHEPFAIAIFGGWALLAGLLQLLTALARRRQMGGQWAMILSGTQSTVAGVAFIMGGLAMKIHIQNIAGYAVFGAVYFLIGGILIGRKLAKGQ